MRVLTDRLSVHVDEPDRFFVRVGNSNGAAHLLLSGRFDASALLALDHAIWKVRHRDLVLDLGALTFMDGAAWMAVMRLEDRVQDWGKTLRLVNARGRIRRLFELTGTDHLFFEAATG